MNRIEDEPGYVWATLPPQRDIIDIDFTPYEKSMALGQYSARKVNPAFFCRVIITLDGIRYESLSE